MHVIAIGNQKGGVGKTTTAAVLAVLLSRQSRRVHVIDLDPQASLTASLGQHDETGQLYLALKERTALPVVTLNDYLTLTPSSIDLARGESEFIGEAGREYLLRESLEKTGLPNDTIVLIDCPPSLGVLGINCFTAADKLLVVVQPGGFELQALARLSETVGVLRQRINERLEILGAVLTNVNQRRLITSQIRDEIKKHYRVLGAIRTDAQLLYATTEGRILGHTSSNGLHDYGRVVARLKELLA